MVQFHQSYTYEDFRHGLSAPSEDRLRVEVRAPSIRFCRKAADRP